MGFPYFFDIYIVIHADDLLVAGTSQQAIPHILFNLEGSLKPRLESEHKDFLGVTIERDRKKGWIYMKNWLITNELLESLEWLILSQSLHECQEIYSSGSKIITEELRNFLGALLSISVTCQPEIAISCSYLSCITIIKLDTTYIAVTRLLK